MLIDSHCHLNMLDKYPDHLDDVFAAAKKNGVTHMLCVCVTLDKLPQILAIAEKYPQVSASVGVHPTEELETEPSIEALLNLAQHPKIVAIGETGLDYYRSADQDMQWQRNRFANHISVAKQSKKPLIIHTRAAQKDTIAMMKSEQAHSGVMHCFTEDWDMAQQALDLGFYISISGIVTFKNALQVIDVAKKVPLDRLLVETDAPYLAPVPFRGKPNQPAYVYHTAEAIAQLRGISFDEIAQATTQNYINLFSATQLN
jgi:TatD DNase family protein